MIRTSVAVLLTFICVALFACSGSSEDSYESGPLSPELEALLAEIAEVRGLQAPNGLRIGAIPREEVATFVDGLLTDVDRAAMANATTLYRLLGHFSANQDYRSSYLQLLTTAAIGFYAPENKTLWLVQDSIELDPASMSELQLNTVAHEFVHAVQDHNFRLERLRDGISVLDDSSLALDAVLEGDAVTHERLWTMERLNGARGGLRAVLVSFAQATVPPSFERELRFPYSAGLDWSGAIRADEGQQAIDTILRERRPMTTAEIMHPHIRDTGWLPTAVTLPDIAAGMGDGWARQAGGVLGEFRLANYLQLRLPSLEALGGAQGWSGDRFDVYSNESETLAVVRLHFADAKEAGEFAQTHLRFLQAASSAIEEREADTMATLPDGRAVVQLRDTANDEVIFVIGSSSEIATTAAGLLRTL